MFLGPSNAGVNHAGVNPRSLWHWLAIHSSHCELAVGHPTASAREQTNAIWASHDLSLAIQTPRVFDWVFGGGELGIGLQVMSVECPNIGLHMCAGSGTAHCQFTL